MNLPASFRGSFVPVLQRNSCCIIRFQPLAVPRVTGRRKYGSLRFSK